MLNNLYELARIQYDHRAEIGKFYVSETLMKRKIQNNQELQTLITKFASKGISQLKKEVILAWISTSMDRDVYSIRAEEEYYLNEINLGKSALSLAAKRISEGINCTVFSIEGGEDDFYFNPLKVAQCISSKQVDLFSVDNYWNKHDFKSKLLGRDLIDSWESMTNFAERIYPYLEFGKFLDNSRKLDKRNFDRDICEKVLDLFHILNEYAENNDENRNENERATEIRKKYFLRKSDKFAPESAPNKKKFRKKLTFMSTRRAPQFADFHGRIREINFRLHVESPLSNWNKKIEIFYLGPKITM